MHPCSVVAAMLAALALPLAAESKPAAKPAKSPPAYHASVPEPTVRGLRYGSHERHVIDFWKAPSTKPTPMVMVIHGGAWKLGEKERVHRFAQVSRLLDAGISVAAINYRLMRHAAAEGVKPPVKAPMDDAARALQFLRSKAGELNIDPTRIAAAGGSAGACTSLWLAYHDDLADPASSDPVARQSTRLDCAAVTGPQTSLDPQQIKDWIPNSTYGGHAFGHESFAAFLANREKILPWIREYSPYGMATKDDPPVYLFYSAAPSPGKPTKDPTHSANFGVKLKEHCDTLGLSCELVHPGITQPEHPTATDYLIWRLTRE